MRHRLWFLTLATSILVCSSAIAQNGGLKFTLTDLGTFVNFGYQSEAWAINKNGQIVGDYWWQKSRFAGQGCFSKLPGQTAVTFGNSPCVARAVNAGGAIAGWMTFGSATHAFRRDTSGSIKELLPHNSLGLDSWGYGIDAFGGVVGSDLYDDGTGGWYYYGAVQWNNAGSATLLWYNDFAAVAYTTNPAGIYAAGYLYWDPPIAWFAGTTVHLSTFADCGWSPIGAVLAMNNGNYMVGWDATRPCGTSHAVLWAPGEIDLGPGVAYAISADERVVGVNDSNLGFLRVSDPVCPQTVALNLLLDSSGTGWSVNAAYGINDSHQIVGQGLAPNGQYHAILLTPVNNLPLCYPD